MATDVAPTVEVPVIIPKSMFHELEDLAAAMGLSAEEFVELALKQFIAQQHIEQSLSLPSAEALSDLDDEEVFREHRRAYQRRRLMADEDNAW